MESKYKIIRIERIMNELARYITNADKNYIQEKLDEAARLSTDGRNISSILEPTIKVLIKEWSEKSKLFYLYDLKLIDPPPRACYDIMIASDADDIIIPIDIKISNFESNSADNLNFETSVSFIAAGAEMEKSGRQKETIKKNLKQLNKEKRPPIDFYYLVVDKNLDYNEDGSLHIYYTSILTMKEISSNASNGIQANWTKNIEAGRTCLIEPTEEMLNNDDHAELPRRVYRSYEDSITLLIDKMKESIEKRMIQVRKDRQNLRLISSMMHDRSLGELPDDNEDNEEPMLLLEEPERIEEINDTGEQQLDNN